MKALYVKSVLEIVKIHLSEVLMVILRDNVFSKSHC